MSLWVNLRVNGKEDQMLTFEEYMKEHPKVARSRAERMLSESCLFQKNRGDNLAWLPEGSSSDYLVAVNLDRMTCGCNVFRQKKACPHIAAALGFIEKNGGKIPYTDIVAYAYACLEELKSDKGYYPGYYFSRILRPFIGQIPRKDLAKIFMELARCLQKPGSRLSENEFLNFYSLMLSDNYENIRLTNRLFENRHQCFKAVVVLIQSAFPCPFSDEMKEIVVKEIADNDTLTEQYISYIVIDHSSYFSREQLLAYYKKTNSASNTWRIAEIVMKRLVGEEPPLYDEFLEIYNKQTDRCFYTPSLALIQKMIQAGYEDRMEKLFRELILKIKDMDDYLLLSQVIPRDRFLTAWRNRHKSENISWSRLSKDFDQVLDFIIDPETDLEVLDMELDALSYKVLEVMMDARPEYCKEINNAVRKKYRRAVKANNPRSVMDALMLLARGGDSIAVKYAAEWKDSKGIAEDLVYIAAVGMKFDSLQKLLPELQKMEVTHAAGQN